MRVECESSKLTPWPLFKGRMAGHRWERPSSTASDCWKRLGPLAVGRGPADPRVRPNPRWATLLTARAHYPSNRQKLLKLWCRPNFASKRCSNLFFKGFSCSEIFLDFCEKQKKVPKKFLVCKSVFENSNIQWEKSKNSRKAKWWKVNMRYVPIYLR